MKSLQALSLEAWASSSSEGVLVVQPNGVISLCNARLKALLFLDALPNHVDELLAMAGTSIPELALLLKTAIRSDQMHWGTLVIQRHPSERLTWQQIPLHDGGQLVGTLTVVREAAAQGVDLTKQSFLSMVSHDLRTPLSTILGFAELLHNNRDTFSGDEQQEFLEHIIKNANELTRYTQIALDILFLEANVQALDLEAVPIDNSIRRWLTDTQHRQAPDRVVYQGRAENDPSVRLVPSALYRILTILVDFALAESPVDEPVTISLSTNTTQAHVTVRHKAPDLNEDDAVMLFQMMHPRDLSEMGRPKLHRMQLYVASLLAQRQQGYLALHVQPDRFYEMDLVLLLATDSKPSDQS